MSVWFGPIFLAGVALGAIVERWRWLHSACARSWTERTGEKGRLL